MRFLSHIPTIPLLNGYYLREILVSDGAALFPTLSDTENHKFTMYDPHKDVEQTMQWIESESADSSVWTIALQDDTAIGFVGYRPADSEEQVCMISYHLNKDYWGRGIVPAAISLTDSHLFSNTPIVKIAATVKPENVQSIKCLEKSGYYLEKIITDYVSKAVNDRSRIRHYYTKQKG